MAPLMGLVRWGSRAARLARVHGLLFMAMALGSCRDGDTAKATPASAPVTPGAVAAPPSASVPIDGLEAADLARVRDAVARWSSDKGAGRLVVETTESFGAGPALAVRAESAGTPCHATMWLLEIPGDLVRSASGPIAVSEIRARSLGDDCCGGVSCERRPGLGWMIHLLHVVSAGGNDREARLLVGSSGLTVVTECHGDGCIEVGASRVEVSAASVDARTLREAVGGLGLRDNIECDEHGETFSCRAHGGGFEGRFEWRRVGARAVLIEMRTAGH
jgi:hypothetical protein